MAAQFDQCIFSFRTNMFDNIITCLYTECRLDKLRIKVNVKDCLQIGVTRHTDILNLLLRTLHFKITIIWILCTIINYSRFLKYYQTKHHHKCINLKPCSLFQIHVKQFIYSHLPTETTKNPGASKKQYLRKLFEGSGEVKGPPLT